VRCFVAVDLSGEARDAVAEAAGALRERGPRADVKWVDPANLHLTLEFLGEVTEDRIVAVRAALGRVAGGHAPFELGMAGIGGFPSLGRPRVLWAGVSHGLRELGLLAADVERAMAPLGFPPESRPFSGHVTLGRVRTPRGLRRVLDAAAALEGQPFGAWTVREIVLYRSHLRPSGSVYEPLATLALGRSVVEDGQ
jgi:2'-5' RNA ligase